MTFIVRLRITAPWLVVIGGVAGSVVLLGSHLTGGQPPEPATSAEDTTIEFPTALRSPTPPLPEIRGFFVTPAFTVTPTPIERKVVAGQEIILPEAVSFHQIINPSNGPGGETWALTYHDDAGVSRVYLDENGEILASEVISKHKEIFEPLLPSAYLPH